MSTCYPPFMRPPWQFWARGTETTMSLLQNQPVLWTVSKMGGVDLSDQINQYDSCLRKTTKWYKKLFFHLFNLCIVNSYLLYKKFGERKLNSHDFKIALARSLIEEAPDAPKPNTSRGRKHTSDKAARLTERHFPENIPAKPGAKRLKPCRDCYACNPKKTARQGFKRKQTSFWCPDCEKALRVPDCFRVYHSMQNYRAVLLPGAGSDSDSDWKLCVKLCKTICKTLLHVTNFPWTINDKQWQNVWIISLFFVILPVNCIVYLSFKNDLNKKIPTMYDLLI